MLYICSGMFDHLILGARFQEGAKGAFTYSFTVFSPLNIQLMIATLDRLLALSRKLHTAKVQSESEPIYVALDLNELQLLKRLADDYLEESETVLYESDHRAVA